MNIYNQIIILGLALACFWIYRDFSRNKIITKDDLESGLTDLEKEKEQKVRRLWLFTYLIQFFTLIIMFIIAGYLDSKKNTVAIDPGPFAYSISLIFIGVWIPYHCAYRKRGTAWLMWSIVMGGLKELKDIADTQFNSLDGITLLLCIFCFGIDIYHWINCCRLHSVNTLRKDRLAQTLKAKQSSCVNTQN